MKTETIPKVAIQGSGRDWSTIKEMVDQLDPYIRNPRWAKLLPELCLLDRLDPGGLVPSRIFTKICVGNIFHQRVEKSLMLRLCIRKLLSLFLRSPEYEQICQKYLVPTIENAWSANVLFGRSVILFLVRIQRS